MQATTTRRRRRPDACHTKGKRPQQECGFQAAAGRTVVVSSGNPHCHCHCQFNTRVDSMAINPIRSKQKESVDFCDCFCCCWEREDRFLCKIWVVSCSMQSYLSPASAVLPPKVETLVVVKENSLVSLFFSACDTISYKSRDDGVSCRQAGNLPLSEFSRNKESCVRLTHSLVRFSDDARRFFSMS